MTFGILCVLYVAWGVTLTHGSAVGRGIASGIFALLATGIFWAYRRNFRKALAQPIARHGPVTRWLLTLPSWLVVLTYLAFVVVILALGSAALDVAQLPQRGFIYSAGPTFFLLAWTGIAELVQLRRTRVGPG